MNESALQRIRWRALETTRHQQQCADCGAEPIVTLDDDHKPVLACRNHPAAGVKGRDG